MGGLEDTLYSLAVIRTTFETLDVFPEDEELRTEMMEIISDARGELVHCLREAHSGLASDPLLGRDDQLQRFKEYFLRMVSRGTDRRRLDSLMKVDLFTSAGAAEANRAEEPFDGKYRYEFRPEQELSLLWSLPARTFLDCVFQDLLNAVTHEPNFLSRHLFERYVFQKFIAVLFVIYATMDPLSGDLPS